MSTKNCITHSFACDCREEKFRKLEEKNEELAIEVDRLILALEIRDAEKELGIK